MYTLHIANKNYSSWSLRPWVLMRSLGIPFHEQLHVFRPGSNYEDFRKFSPNGRVPCLVDGSEVVWDSLAIAEYLAERHPGVWPADARARVFARCVAAEMHSGFSVLRNDCSMSVGIRVRLNAVSAALAADVARIDEIWTTGVQRFGGPFLAGAAFTAADAFYAPVAFRVQTYALKLGAVANGYCSRLLAQPAMQTWYQEGVAETWRDAPHEQDVAAVGTVTEDLRAKA